MVFYKTKAQRKTVNACLLWYGSYIVHEAKYFLKINYDKLKMHTVISRVNN